MTVGSSPFVVTKAAAKNQDVDIFTNSYKEIELENITLSDKLERGDIVDFQGYVECDGILLLLLVQLRVLKVMMVLLL